MTAVTAMSRNFSNLAGRYLRTLRKFATTKREADLEQAYALGRKAMSLKFGVLDMARIHQAALASLLAKPTDGKREKLLEAAEVFFLEALSPFEVTHRGFNEANRRLQRLIAEKEKRNHDLAVINDRLTAEIRRRKLTEKALRQSEQHYRRLFDDARAMEEGLRDLSNKVLDVQEDERKRISRELHDETGQALTAISVTLASLGRNEQISGIGQQRLHEAQDLLRSTMETIHNFARELRPAMLDELGLLPALRSYLAAFAERTGLHIRFRANPLAEALTANAKIVLYRVAQESLTNVAKHAQAQRVDFRIRKVNSRISMMISDDGKSYRELPPEVLKQEHRLGLLGMQERVRLVNGQIAIRPRVGKGTTINVLVPLNGAVERRENNLAALG